jgi:hypothetical protein
LVSWPFSVTWQSLWVQRMDRSKFRSLIQFRSDQSATLAIKVLAKAPFFYRMIAQWHSHKTFLYV